MGKDLIERYRALNSLAEQGGIVIFGGSDDMSIPLGELRQAFDIESRLYNRSLPELSLRGAVRAFDECVAPLEPETLLLHLGIADLELMDRDPRAFDCAYRALITHVKNALPDCRIVVVSFANYDNDAKLSALDHELCYIAESEQCRFADVAERRVWNPRETQGVMSFVSKLGLGRAAHSKPLYDLVRILFCSEAAMA